jgi:peptidoglycan/LPS O-acetylase OafA/YrhL
VPVAASARRDRYFDLLRGLALVRVVAYHALGLWFLHIAFPAIGVMFGLAGSLMARSLDRRSALHVVGSRMRRLLPPVWAYAVVAIAVGWELLGSGWWHLVFWVFPLRDPYASPFGSGFVDTLWYLRTYLWFVLLSPAMLWAFRKAPALLLPLPMILIPIVDLGGGRLADHGLISDLCVYGTCWMLGFAENDGLLAEVRLRWIAAGAAIVAGLGLALLLLTPITPPTEASTVGYALWSAAFVVALLRWRPRLTWLTPALARILDVINARAVTIYLWHDAAIVLSLGLAAWLRLPAVFLLTGLAALMVGWIEDVAAGRRPALIPRSPAAPPPRTALPETAPRSPQPVRASNSR